MPHNTVPIDAEVAVVADRLARLLQQRERQLTKRKDGILDDCRAGMSNQDIADKWATSYSAVSQLIHRAGLAGVRRRIMATLTPEQRRHYEISVRAGARSSVARQIALAVSP